MSPRKYESPLREAQAKLTRDRIFEAARDHIEEHSLESLTIPKVAKRAGVSAPTAYKHFADVEALLHAFAAWLRPLIGTHFPAETPVDYAMGPGSAFPRFEEFTAILTPLLSNATWHEIRTKGSPERARKLSERAAVLLQVGAESALLVGAALHAFRAPPMWRWLRRTWGLNAEEAVHVASWVVHLIVKELTENPSSLSEFRVPQPNGD